MHTPDETRPAEDVKLFLTVRDDHFSLEGKFTMTEAVAAITAWGELLKGPDADKAQIEKLTGEIDDETTKDEAALGTSTVPAKV